jgi:hypothetical protein
LILVDTSVWIDFLRGKEPIASELMPLLDGGLVQAIEPVFGELLQGCRNSAETTRILKYWQDLPRIHIPELLIAAGKHSGTHRLAAMGLGLTDSAILVAAQMYHCSVWTLDKMLLRQVPASARYRPMQSS